MSNSDLPLVFVGVPVAPGGLHDVTDNALRIFESIDHGLPYRFILRKLKWYSAPFATNLLLAMARKAGAAKFLRIDADMNFAPHHVARILARPERCVGGLYPKKELSLDQKWVANFLEDRVGADGLIEATEVGAGFLKIDMDLVHELERLPGDNKFLLDVPISCQGSADACGLKVGDPIVDLFGERIVVDDWHGDGDLWARWLSDDFSFCHRVRSIREKVWVDTKCQVGHIGWVDFYNVLRMLEALKKSGPTAGDPEAAVRAMLPT